MIGLITANYNQYEQTRAFLDSLTQVTDCSNLYLYLADVSSKKQEIHVSDYPFKIKIATLPNKGYAFVINEGIRFFLNQGLIQFCAINNDIYFKKNFAQEAATGFKIADIFGGKIYYAPGFEYHKNRYRLEDRGKVIWYAGGKIDWRNVLCLHRGVDEIDLGQYDRFEKTDFITGCLIFFNKKVIDKVGYWREEYFLYFEDADFCERAKKAGFTLYYNPKIVIYHQVSQSTQGSGSEFQRHYQERNRLIFGLKYAPFRTKIHLIKNCVFNKFNNLFKK
ncbi:MAG: glycosyltransferase family 2 protein [Patescibacteria group bacterium]|nr:glycosyltransferase family 2 protein [Patescibacteria group bacterium]